MARFFNTAGPVDAAKHYAIDPLGRLLRDEVLGLIDQEKCFMLHGPRQTGKTSALLALVNVLNATGRYSAVYCNVEAAQAVRNDVGRGIDIILGELAERAGQFVQERWIVDLVQQVRREGDLGGALNIALRRWSALSDKPLVVLFDEIDALVGDTLISVLRQLRAGYDSRPAHFPQSVVLCGVRDVRDYRIHTAAHEIITGGSAFNIRAESLRLGDFSRHATCELYAQHTAETGQPFTEEALDLAWDLTAGQPWLVNALAYEVCFKLPAGRDRSIPITAALLEEAKERIVRRRETHLDQLVDKLKEPRVHRLVGPILAGGSTQDSADLARPDDIEYAIDLGLISRGAHGLHIANAIYREVIPRELTWVLQDEFGASHRPSWYIDDATGRLDVPKLLEAFQQFFREHSEHWLQRFDYHEAGPQLLLQAFLQRIVNGGGRIDREYGLGRGRTDLLLRWPTTDDGFHGTPDTIQTAVIELKLLHKSLDHTIRQGLEQTAVYLDRTGAAEGHLVVFDRRADVSWDEKIFVRQERVSVPSPIPTSTPTPTPTPAAGGERSITVWGM